MWTNEKLDQLETTPSPALIEDMKKIGGDIMVLGAGGKMGPTLCILAKRAMEAAGLPYRVIAVSRFSSEKAREELTKHGVEVLPCDLQDVSQLNALPEIENIIFMAGLKFGTDGGEWKTWGMNATLPAFVGEKFKKSRIVVFSSGNVYALCPLADGGSLETDKTGPIGEYTMSVLARERAFEYASNKFGTRVCIFRLNYAIDLRYGILCDIATKIMNHEPISLTTPCVTFIWQGSANENAIRSLLHASSPMEIINVSGPETVSVKQAANRMGELLGIEPIFCGEPQTDAYIENTMKSIQYFGYPAVSAGTLMEWQVEWLKETGYTLGKPTHFEERKGSY
ncbi:MAG: NAD(P)-dependent oxidoreductase [Clostridia bacterium]|nr:NAD(P)-dependent oxidoreductase [Clostridia bacterium]